MAAKSGRTRPAVIDQLIAEPYRFEFFQAVRLLLRAGGVGQLPLPFDASPEQDLVRARVVQSHCFPSAEIVRVERRPADPRQPDRPGRLELFVTMMGLTGPNGVLPRHYTSLIIDRVREKDSTLAEFLDVFNHRSISLFYRAWEKYRFPISFERQRPVREQGQGGDDFFTFCLQCLIGLGTDGLRGRQSLDDDQLCPRRERCSR
jgi:type VI secretion system protein ImpH